MNALAANDIEAADLLGPARRRRAAGPLRPVTVTPWAPVPDIIATAQEPQDQRPPPETSGGHSAVARSPGHPPVTASRAVMIAAASGHARQQLTPALTGVG